MKAVKRLFAAFVALAMVLAMAVPAFAAGETGTITIKNPANGATYHAYEIFKLESHSGNNYSYTVLAGWKGFFETAAEGANYIALDSAGHPTWTAENNTTNKAAFAKAALAYATSKGISASGSVTVAESNKTDVKITGLEEGYYVVDTNVGTLCSLGTVTDNVEIAEKNEQPELEKEVQEDSDNSYGSSNDASIGQVVNFRTTITAQDGAQNYVMHDTMTNGLTFDKTSVKVKLNSADVDASKYGVIENPSDGCTFEVKFADDFCNSLDANNKIVVEYSATLNENAKVNDFDTDDNENTAKLTYGENGEFNTVPSKTETKTYGFDLIKTDNDGNLVGNTEIGNAEFTLWDAKTGGNEIKVIYDNTLNAYRPIKSGETGTHIVATNGRATIKGLDSGNYYLQEEVTPKGYNTLDGRQEIALNASNKTTYESGKYNQAENGGVQVINVSGTLLPSTGGIGTTIFYVVGGGLMAAAVVLLVLKKRGENN